VPGVSVDLPSQLPLPDDDDRRFGGVQRLFGSEGRNRLHQAHIAIIGVGGVGSWVAEALARSGIGRITLVDLDDVCVSNVNRQIQALDGTVGKPKVEALAERLRKIHPTCDIRPWSKFFTATTADEILTKNYTGVIDAIDKLSHKALLLSECRLRKIPVVSCGGAGGRKDPTAIRVEDLSRTRDDVLLMMLRKRLRQQYNFPRERRHKFKIPCVYSTEFPSTSQTAACASDEGEEGESHGMARLDCESGYGTAVFITGIYGFHMAAIAINQIASGEWTNRQPIE
jgi:tRNA threonylcarbamoyladenosine dehydratase